MRTLSSAAMSVWAKSPRAAQGVGTWLPLWRHLDDSAAVAGRLWDRWLPSAVRRVVSDPLPGGEEAGRSLVRWLAGVHDIGKATPAFAVKVEPLARKMAAEGLSMPAVPYADRKLAMHATTGQVLLEVWLTGECGWSVAAARQFAVVVGGHHGVPPAEGDLQRAHERPHLLGLAHQQGSWRDVHNELLNRTAYATGAAAHLDAWREIWLGQPTQAILTALVIIADWIASNEELFSYDFAALHAASRLDDAWAEIDLPTPWQPIASSLPPEELFARRFALPADATVRPVQASAHRIARTMPGSGLMIIEAPMGEGKTEAALAAAEVLAHRSGGGGCFFALPTRATSDAMFRRVLSWLEKLPDADPDRGALSVMLAHGKARLNDDFDSLMRRGHSVDVGTDADDSGRELAAHRWLSGRKKALLSSFVIGTIDQLLFASLRSRHLMLRHLGLAGKVVIIDEAHAYDVYMSQYLDRALEWLAAYQVSTIVLSATLPAARRKAMVCAYDRGRGLAPAATPRRRSWRAAPPPAEETADPYAVLDGDIGYPVLVASNEGEAPVVEVAEPSGREVAVGLERADDEPDTLARLLHEELTQGGCALVVRNTVRRVQETASRLRQLLDGSGIEVSVAHSRFLAPDRAAKDRWLSEAFGPPDSSGVSTARPKSHVVVASQVAEQSLDIDFDLLVTDVAPVDLVLQRMGRLHRHPRDKDQSQRPPRLRHARCVITGADWTTGPPEPAPGSVRVYGRHTLLRSLAVLQPHLEGERPVHLPTDIAPLVQPAYAEGPLGPQDWRPAMETARRDHDRLRDKKEDRARTFRLGPVGPVGEPITGWLDAGVGDADDNPQGRAQVRDTGADTVEVLVLVRRSDGALVTPPWLPRDGGREVPTEHIPPPRLAKTVASCTLSLPVPLSDRAVIEELEQHHYYPAWQESPWLAEQLLLVLDEHGEAEVTGHHLRYDPTNGLEVRSD